jgi:hypothetical protein
LKSASRTTWTWIISSEFLGKLLIAMDDAESHASR